MLYRGTPSFLPSCSDDERDGEGWLRPSKDGVRLPAWLECEGRKAWLRGTQQPQTMKSRASPGGRGAMVLRRVDREVVSGGSMNERSKTLSKLG